MSTPPVLAAGNGELSPAALAAGERVQRLQGLIDEIESGSGSFAAALQTAVGGSSGAASTGSGAASAVDAAYTGSAGTQLQGGFGIGTEPAAGGAASASYPATDPSTGAGSGAGEAYSGLIDEAATQNGVEPAVLHGLIQQESGFDPNATSSAGALGLTQLMPGTASSLGVTEPLNPAQSIEGGARYLGELLRQFGGNVTDALAAYNAGPGAVQQYGGVPPYAETQQYVAKVLENANAYRPSAATSTVPAMQGETI